MRVQSHLFLVSGVYPIICLVGLVCALLAFYRALHDHFYMRKQLAELELRAKVLQLRLEQQGQLANEVAHEVKNPISAILCSAEALDLLAGSKLEPAQRACLKYIIEYGDSLLRIVSDYIDLNRVEAGQIKIVKQEVSLLESVQKVLAMLQSGALRKQLTISCRNLNEPLSALTDERYLKQILFNLLHSAVKTAPVGASIAVEIAAQSDRGEVEVRIYPAAGDGSSKLPSDQAQELEERLAMAVSHSLASLISSRVEIRKDDADRIFQVIVFPAVAVERSAQEFNGFDVVGHKQPLCGKNYLVINRELGHNAALALLVESWGGMVDQVRSAAEAVQSLTAKSYSAIVFDHEDRQVNLGELKRILALGGRGDVKLIATSDGEFGRDDSADFKTILKPIRGATLLKALLS